MAKKQQSLILVRTAVCLVFCGLDRVHILSMFRHDWRVLSCSCSCVVLGLVLVLIHRGPREASSDAAVL